MTGTAAAPFWRDWYEIVTTDTLRQGDIFRELLAFWLPQDLPVLQQNPEGDQFTEVAVGFARGDWIVLSASCDIARADDSHVLLARILPATSAELKAQNAGDLKSKLEVLRQGYDPTKFLLAENEEIAPQLPRSFVQYRIQAFLPIRYLKAHCKGPRLRLKPPFREKFGAWAGANLGRVGIEDESQIPRIGGHAASHILRAIEDTA